MSAGKKLAVVTGSNKGIGFAAVRALCKQFDGDVLLTSRTDSNGEEAIKKLAAEGLTAKKHQLDITDPSSVQRLAEFIKKTYGGLDILINNAGIAFKSAATEPFSEQAEVSMKCNFWGTLDLCNALFPLLRPNARVVNVSSMASQYAGKKCSKELQTRFLNPNLTMSDVETLMTEFVQSAKDNTYQAKGWPNSAYGTTKIGVTLMTFVQQKQFTKDDIIVNACCPGYVDTDMSSHKGPKTIDQGADTPVFLAMLPPNTSGPRGKFLSDRKVQEWP